MTISFLQMAQKVLYEEKQPLSATEIWRCAVDKGYDKLVGSKGKTPWATLGSLLHTDIRENSATVFVSIGARPIKFVLTSQDQNFPAPMFEKTNTFKGETMNINHDEPSQIEGDEQENDEEAIFIPVNKRELRTSSIDAEIESLYNKWKRGKLILQPRFQRKFVWDHAKSSRLIESALLSVPLPIIYLAEEEDGKVSVIDGQQRLTSFFSFIDGKFPDGNVFRLTGIKVFSELSKKTFQEIEDEQQEKIHGYTIRTITILKDSNSDIKFEIFKRLNTGAEPLNEMELRNCIYMGTYMDLLKELAEDQDFKQLTRLSNTRMQDVEFVLRFAAFYHFTYLKYQSPMKKFFNKDMEKYREIPKSDADDLQKAFKNSIQIIKSLFGDNAFRRFKVGNSNNPDGAWETKFNASLFDALMGVFCDKDKTQVYGVLDTLREGIIELMGSNTEFIDAILLGTSEQVRVKKRFDLLRMLVDEILQNQRRQPRCFSLALKQALFENNPTCSICGQRIQAIDDSAVDHIEQYWKGGKTIPENARLTHRFCNNARPRKEKQE